MPAEESPGMEAYGLEVVVTILFELPCRDRLRVKCKPVSSNTRMQPSAAVGNKCRKESTAETPSSGKEKCGPLLAETD